jgi:hypothetical protein
MRHNNAVYKLGRGGRRPDQTLTLGFIPLLCDMKYYMILSKRVPVYVCTVHPHPLGNALHMISKERV